MSFCLIRLSRAQLLTVVQQFVVPDSSVDCLVLFRKEGPLSRLQSGLCSGKFLPSLSTNIQILSTCLASLFDVMGNDRARKP